MCTYLQAKMSIRFDWNKTKLNPSLNRPYKYRFITLNSKKIRLFLQRFDFPTIFHHLQSPYIRKAARSKYKNNIFIVSCVYSFD